LGECQAMMTHLSRPLTLLLSVLFVLFFSARSYASEKNKPATPAAPAQPAFSEVVIMGVGDILPDPSWGKFDISVDKLFKNVNEKLFEASLVIGNLESPLTGKKQPAAKGPRPEENKVAAGLRDAGFSVLSLANNHVMDLKAEGLLETIAGLKQAGLKYAGAGADIAEASLPAEAEANGLKVLVISASDVVPAGSEAAADRPGIRSMKDAAQLVEQVKKVRAANARALIVMSLHWGVEAAYTPTGRQKDIAHNLIDAGADLIFGHHPHRLQGVELYKGKPVFYSLGNFQFDCKSPGNESVIAKVVYRDGKFDPASISLIPVFIESGGIPKILKGDAPMHGAIIKKLDGMDKAFGTMMKGEDLLPRPDSEADEVPEDFTPFGE
jgi:poly-gamma-glutamate capsule biosynthesis protein CapA/YwtB (metallophosphatase superfamily)